MKVSTANTGLFSDRLLDARNKKRLSQTELASKVGLSPSVISSYEAGTYRPRADKIRRLAEVLDIKPEYLAGEDGGAGRDQDLTSNNEMQFHPKVEQLLEELIDEGGYESRKECIAALIREKAGEREQKDIAPPASGIEAARARREAMRSRRRKKTEKGG